MYLVVPPGGCFREMRRIELGPAPLTIGRSEACEIQVDVPGVDGEHAKISEVALIAIGADCAVGDVPLDPGHRRLVMPGDEIQIGSVVIALEGHDPSIAPPPPDALGRPRQTRAPRIRVVEGANFGDELLLQEENREYIIGRAPKCDLVLEDREVSRQHLTLTRRGYSIFIKDLTSTRGSWLGRSAVYTAGIVEWLRPRMLKVGQTVMSLELPEEVRRQAPQAQASAPMTPPPRSRSHPLAQSYGGGSPPSSHPAPHEGPNDVTRKITPGYTGPPAPAPGMPQQQQHQPMAATGPAIRFVQNEPVPPPSNALKRKAWKKGGPSIGRVSGLLLLALAGLAILGALFIVFSILE